MSNNEFNAHRILAMEARIKELETTLKETLKLLKDSTENFDRMVELLSKNTD